MRHTLESYELNWPSSLNPNHVRCEPGLNGRRPLNGWVPLDMSNTLNSSICIFGNKTYFSLFQWKQILQQIIYQQNDLYFISEWTSWLNNQDLDSDYESRKLGPLAICVQPLLSLSLSLKVGRLIIIEVRPDHLREDNQKHEWQLQVDFWSLMQSLLGHQGTEYASAIICRWKYKHKWENKSVRTMKIKHKIIY